jgi:protein-S-isoprenylcysteine O-methyltransferase Ste14
VTFFGWLAAIVLFLHCRFRSTGLWCIHRRGSGAPIRPPLTLWGCCFRGPPVTAAIIFYWRELFRPDRASAAEIVAGLALIVFEGWIFWRVDHDPGTARLMGKTELTGGGEMTRHGICARIRHPRYAGSFLAVVGACLLAGTRPMWFVAEVWLALTLAAIPLKERKLRTRFGEAYEEYSRRVPRFVPSLRK